METLAICRWDSNCLHSLHAIAEGLHPGGEQRPIQPQLRSARVPAVAALREPGNLGGYRCGS
jgi:hypothetical protein